MAELVTIGMTPPRSASAVLAGVALLCVLASCGTSATPTQTSPATTAAPTSAAPASSAAPSAACTDVGALKSSLQALTKVKPAEDGVPALKTAIADVKADLGPAQASASEALKPSVEQVKVAFGNLQTAAAGLTADNRKEKAPSISAALEEVRTATAALSSTLDQSCPVS